MQTAVFAEPCREYGGTHAVSPSNTLNPTKSPGGLPNKPHNNSCDASANLTTWPFCLCGEQNLSKIRVKACVEVRKDFASRLQMMQLMKPHKDKPSKKHAGQEQTSQRKIPTYPTLFCGGSRMCRIPKLAKRLATTTTCNCPRWKHYWNKLLC